MRLQDLFIDETMTIKEALKKLDETAKKILIVTEYNKLKAVITDGDIRRWILRSGDLSKTVSLIMNKKPVFLTIGNEHLAEKLMKEKFIESIPVVNKNKEVVNVIFWNEKFKDRLNYFNKIQNPVVIMAGGKGTRLYPFTKIFPKPLIPIGEIPIVERIMNRFREYGCDDFYLTVNYKKNMIRAYFNELKKDYKINYVEEERPLGTGGSLHLLKGKINNTFFVSNCDILIDGNYSDMLRFHKENKNKITMITSLKHYAIPYGVIKLNEDETIKNIVEKPEYDFLVNTGMYILDPETIEDVPENDFYHITDLINYYIKKGEKVGAYPVSDKSWLDMGQFKEMENMIERLGLK
ncbi:nucleotidyltransferase family protein [Tepidibacter aestuarii]|uniref:nucleotidyltransferase family protein n=1 Tax=Tepidibacter aestuarii TaxID=2925782 RepID=UPI0020C0ADCA|nr:nucleotidyltransferase family protein [Tepidibacter aestuarii]CAH2211892.1 CBS domain-containing protein [Tepidibacter aestuarii]